MEITFDYPDLFESCLRLVVAVAAGAVLGLDRELRHRKVGIRTYMLVALGAAGFTLITMKMAGVAAAEGLGADPTRIVQGLVGAIGFLGAGAIIQGDRRVGGMATAASLWVAGAVGMASGLGYYAHAAAIAVISGAILSMSHLMQHRGAEDRPDIE